MFTQFTSAIALLFAILDYVYKAVVSFRETEQGRAEWLDIEAAYQDVTGDVLESAEIRAEATAQRQQNAVSAQRGSRVPSERRNSGEGQ